MGKSNSLEDIAVGFDDEACLEIDNGIEKVYSDTINSIQVNIREEIVNKVATSWYSEIAVEYFKTFQTACSNASDDIKMVFQNFRDQMQNNINTWRTQTGDKSNKQLQDVAEKTITIDISKIKEIDSSGNRYISNSIEQDLNGWIDTCRQLIINDIGLSIAERTIGSFIGENQNSTINNAMESLADVINSILCFLNTGDNSILTSIANYRKEYSETGKKVGIDTEQRDYGAGADTQGGADDGSSANHSGGGNNPGGGRNNPGGGSNPGGGNNPAGGNNPGGGSNPGGGNNQGGGRDPRDMRPSYMQQTGNQPIATGTYNQTAPQNPMTLEELDAQEKERYNNMSDWERMLTRNMDQVWVGSVGWVESIVDFGGTIAVGITGNEDIAKFVARDFEQETQDEFDKVHTDYAGRKYKDDTLLETPWGTIHKSDTEAASRLTTKVALDIASLNGLGAMGTAAKGADLSAKSLKIIKAGYIGMKNIGDSGEQAIGAATRDGRNAQVAAWGASTAGTLKTAATMGADVGIDIFANPQNGAGFVTNVARRAGLNGAAGLANQIVQSGENAYSGDKTTPGDFAIGTLGKAGQSAFFSAIQLGKGGTLVQEGSSKAAFDLISGIADAATN